MSGRRKNNHIINLYIHKIPDPSSFINEYPIELLRKGLLKLRKNNLRNRKERHSSELTLLKWPEVAKINLQKKTKFDYLYYLLSRLTIKL